LTGYSRPHSRHFRPLTKLMRILSVLSSLDKGKMKKPRAKLARGFFQPFRSCLAVFYVEQVALNRHVHGQKNKEQSEMKLQVISPIASASRRTFPACQRGHFALRVGWLGRAGGIVMLPAVVPVGHKNVVENHSAQAQHDHLPNIADV